ncbi:MAG: methyltransferase domain-containing protein [Chloroflexi bacterium]|nr:MAG: methyltransferase domain-containing protein [Chloroflexota bacterium]TME19686.1 MAG: methyltransferase domain-containing protein [Chloroflexota bacterium]
MNPVQVTPQLERYIFDLLGPRDAPMRAMEEHAERENVPIVGPHEGKLLYLLAKLAGSKRILELGAATGYSGAWLLRATAGGSLVTIERDPRRAALARANLAAAVPNGDAEVLEGDVFQVLPHLEGPFDACFNDLLNSLASEQDIERLFMLSLEKVRPGGLLLADNALRQGEVSAPRGQQARNVAAYNKLVAATPRLESVIVPIRDGLSIALVSD